MQHRSGLTLDVTAPSNPQFAMQVAGPETYLPPMPTAVVLLKPDDMARNRDFCSAMSRLPTMGEALAFATVTPNLIMTRWLSQLSDVPADRVRDCDYMAGTYDYGRAAELMASVQVAPGSAYGRGPFLALLIPSDAGLRVIAVDGSRYESAGFSAFIESWNTAMTRVQGQLTSKPDRPGLFRSVVDLAAAVLRTVFGATTGLVVGALKTL